MVTGLHRKVMGALVRREIKVHLEYRIVAFLEMVADFFFFFFWCLNSSQTPHLQTLLL